MLEKKSLFYIGVATIFFMFVWHVAFKFLVDIPIETLDLFYITASFLVTATFAFQLYLALKESVELDEEEWKETAALYSVIPALIGIGLDLWLLAVYVNRHSDSFARETDVNPLLMITALFGLGGLPIVIAINQAYDLIGLLNKKREIETPEPAVKDEQYLDVIDQHRPALPSKAKTAYLTAAKSVVDTYEAERLAPTTDENTLSRRVYISNPMPLADTKKLVIEQYQKLAEEWPRPDGFPPFRLFPPDRKQIQVWNEFTSAIKPILSWEAKSTNPFDDVLPLLPQVQDGVKRFEGMFMLAPSGSGKSTTLQYLINEDLTYLTFSRLAKTHKVPNNGRASIIAMDSTGDFLKALLPRQDFHPDTGAQRNHLIIIEPDVENPIALNPFAFGRSRINAHSAREREKLTNNVIELLTHVFATMADGMKFTPRQALVYRHCVRLCLAIPNSNLGTLAEILSTASVDQYGEYVDQLDETARRFFDGDFRTADIKKVCQVELSWRLNAVLENPTFARILNAPDCKVDFYSALNDGTMVIVNTDRALLGKEQASIFGRLIIAMVRLAMRERDNQPEDERRPVYFYIDEVHEYLDNDNQIAAMIDDVRKSRLALIMVMQRLAQIKDPNVRDALLSCGILLAKPNAEDQMTVAKYMGGVDKAYLSYLKNRQFSLYARGVTGCVTVEVPFFDVKKQHRLTAEEQRRIKWMVAEKYGYRAEAKVAPAKPTKRKKGRDDDIRPGNKL